MPSATFPVTTAKQLLATHEQVFMRDAEAIREELTSLKSDLEATYPIRELGLFGSYARDEQGPESDLDILVTFDRPVTLFELVRLENELSRHLGTDVDLVTRESLRPQIRSQVEKDVVYV
ncbi:nucleotidyltransferase family protein [Halodesulfurarchaeum sp.]|uniref:nucleotidyltransferase family protein n=1 Tax=Halodesulfurarchaeum sp. TaxID=1980530 RepID=UPI002FC36466